MATTYRCAYCGSQQTYSGSGPRMCSHCGATQTEADIASQNSTIFATGKRSWLVLVLMVLVLGGVGLYFGMRGRSGKNAAAAAPMEHSRIVTVRNPPVRELPGNADLSAQDLIRSAPGNAANLLDSGLLSISTPKPMKNTEGALYYVGEVVNHSPDHTAVSPDLQMGVVKNGRVTETSELHFSDLPPGGHSPLFFSWDGSTADIDSLQFRWKPVAGYAVSSPHHPRLEATITGKKMTPGTVTVNFSYTYHFMTADVQGTVVNRGDATANGIQLYLTLRDAKGRVTGFKEKDMDPIAAGEQAQYEISADQWGEPVASMDVQALALSNN